MASLLVLLDLLTPQSAGRKRPKKISVGEATHHLVKFHKVCSILFQILYLMPIFKQIGYKWTFMLCFSHAKVLMTISWPLKETLNHILLLQGLQKHRFSPFTLSWTEKFCLVSHVHPWVHDKLFSVWSIMILCPACTHFFADNYVQNW